MASGTERNNIFGGDIDVRMARDIHEQQRKQKQRDRKRKKQAARRRMTLVLIVLAIACCLGTGIVKLLHSDVFDSEEEFKEFADTYFDDDSVCPSGDIDKREYHFTDGTSYAVRRGNWVNAATKEHLNETIAAVVQQQESAKALLIDASAYEAENGTISTIVQYSTYDAAGRHMKRTSSHVETGLFDPSTGKALDPLQVMNVNYKSKAAEYAGEYFGKAYSKKELSEGWEKFTTSEDANFNKFVITKEQIAFYFDDGTVLNEGEGTPVMDVPLSVIGSTIRPKVLDRYIDKTRPMVALTYDDGPYSKTEEKIIRTLEKNGCVATFFYLGNRVSSDYRNGVRAVRIGCELGNHSWSHPDLSHLETKDVVSQISKTNAVIHKYCGVEPVVARAPYGDYNDEVLKRTGMAQISWSLDTEDWKTRDAESTFKHIREAKNLDGQIVLMHSIYESTAEATEMIIPWLKENGYQTVTVSELIKYKTGKPPQRGKVYEEVK